MLVGVLKRCYAIFSGIILQLAQPHLCTLHSVGVDEPVHNERHRRRIGASKLKTSDPKYKTLSGGEVSLSR